ncbi:DUF58 domain-containing protein [Agromyces sp. Leaf222]|uniref:DUF58 domain-containing protein n=1 Tax=Agromyces sp. Leaf222 TaxID=1735688 RepID=UPI0006FF137B|nr:DUF58 domain-containing protein [Agromyces sp. Leaf222]KQM83200.1 hypothetical protein ASE68_08150 [Agromyces sp. Leaf222]
MARNRLRSLSWPRLTRRGIALIVVGAVLVGISLWFDLRDILLLAFVGLAMPIVAAAFVALRRPSLAVQRSFAPAVVSAGEATRVALVVVNRGRRTLDGAHWRDRAPEGTVGPPSALLPALGPHEIVLPSGDDRVRIEYRLRMPRRGVFPVGPLRIGVTDPFGLANVEREAGAPHEVVVTPRVTPLAEALATAASIDGVVHGLQRRTHPNSDELIAREYRYGDPLRRVNWPATARRGELMVREEEQRGDPEARILLDLPGEGRHGLAVHRERDDLVDERVELAIEVAASIGVHLLENGFRLRCTGIADPEQGLVPTAPYGGEYRMPGGDHQLLEDLARTNPAGRRESARREAGRHDQGRHDHGRHGSDDRGSWAELRSRGRDAREPGFAVLVDPGQAEAAALVALRAGFEPAVAFVTASVTSGVRRMLEDADWHVVDVRRAVEIGGAWSAVATKPTAVHDAS